MKHLRVILAAVLAYAGGAFAADPATAPAADDGSPFVRLYDTGKPIDLSATGPIAAKPDAWRQVTEKDAAHAFEGDAAVVNDQLILLCSKKYDVAVCTKGVGGVEVRALLFPLDTRGGVSSVKIVENTASAVTLEATFKPAEGGEGTVLRIRLSAGAFYVQVRGASRTASLVIADRAPHVVVPDFFGDDFVYDTATPPKADTLLPTESSLLALTDDGRAVVACVWSSPQQGAWLLRPRDERLGAKSAWQSVDLPQDKSIWLAVFEGKDIWRAGKAIAPDWKPPFTAKWRASVVAADESARSWAFVDEAGQPATRPTGLTDRTMVVYPIDRTRATPLTTYCLVDLMREVLGVGPCQYVLDAEKLGSGQAATPEQVARWVEKQFEKKPARRDADAIREQLAAMTAHVEAAQARIDAYRRLGEKVVEISHSMGPTPPHPTLAMGEIGAEMAATSAATGQTPIPRLVADLAAQLAALADKDDAQAKARDALAAIHAAGARQDYELARMRMAVRRLNVLYPESVYPIVKNSETPADKVRQEIQQFHEKLSAGTKPVGKSSKGE